MYSTAGVECFQLKSADGYMQCIPQVDDLACSHEKADIQLLFHAKHASIESDEPILIHSPDTYVLVLAVFICGKDPGSFPLIICVLHQKAWRYISVIDLQAIRCPCVQRFAEYACIGGVIRQVSLLVMNEFP